MNVWTKKVAGICRTLNKSTLEVAVLIYEDRNAPIEDYDEKKHVQTGWKVYTQKDGKKKAVPYRVYPPIGFWVPIGYSTDIQGEIKKVKYWYPHPEEVRPCCWGLMQPVAAYPWHYQRHCRSARHIAMLCNVDERELTARISTRSKQNRCESCKRFIAADLTQCGPCLAKERLTSV